MKGRLYVGNQVRKKRKLKELVKRGIMEKGNKKVDSVYGKPKDKIGRNETERNTRERKVENESLIRKKEKQRSDKEIFEKKEVEDRLHV